MLHILVQALITISSFVYMCSGGDNDVVPQRTFRGAVVLTIAGDRIPAYLGWSCYSFAASADTFDMLIIHEQNQKIIAMTCAKNVIKIDVGHNGLAQLIADAFQSPLNPGRALSQKSDKNSDKEDTDIVMMHKLKSALVKVLRTMPYFLAEFKPATGAIFASYLTHYSHWTYTDPDIFWGNLTRWVPEKDVGDVDVFTMAKMMDAGRLFLRGQFTLHRNEDRINWMWSRMGHMQLDKLLMRMRKAVSAMKRSNDTFAIKRRYFVSAEGAYSSLVFRSRLSVYIAGRMLSDRKAKPVIWKDGALTRCRHHSVPACLDGLQETPLGRCDQIEHDDDEQRPLPPVNATEVSTTTQDCGMGWVGPLHQFCLERWNTVRYNEVFARKGVWRANNEAASRRIRKHDSVMFHFRIWEDIFSTMMKPGAVLPGDPCFITYLDRNRPTTMHIQHCRVPSKVKGRRRLLENM